MARSRPPIASTLFLLASLAAAPAATAQTVSVALRAETPLTVSAGGFTETQPTGPMPPFGEIEATDFFSGSALCNWFAVAGATDASARWFTN